MTIIEQIKAEIERLKNQLVRGACAAQIEMGTNCKEEAYDEVLSFLNAIETEEPVPKDLEDAAEISFDEAKSLTEDYMDFLAKGLIENKPRPIGPHWFCEYAKNRFIAGAEWQKEQIMKYAVEGRVFMSFAPGHNQMIMTDVDLPTNTKVRIIILPNED